MDQRVSAIARHLSIDSTGERDRMVPIDAEVSTSNAQPPHCFSNPGPVVGPFASFFASLFPRSAPQKSPLLSEWNAANLFSATI